MNYTEVNTKQFASKLKELSVGEGFDFAFYGDEGVGSIILLITSRNTRAFPSRNDRKHCYPAYEGRGCEKL